MKIHIRDRAWRKGLLMKMNIMGIHGKMHQWILDRNNYPENSGWDILFQEIPRGRTPKRLRPQLHPVSHFHEWRRSPWAFCWWPCHLDHRKVPNPCKSKNLKSTRYNNSSLHFWGYHDQQAEVQGSPTTILKFYLDFEPSSGPGQDLQGSSSFWEGPSGSKTLVKGHMMATLTEWSHKMFQKALLPRFWSSI